MIFSGTQLTVSGYVRTISYYCLNLENNTISCANRLLWVMQNYLSALWNTFPFLDNKNTISPATSISLYLNSFVNQVIHLWLQPSPSYKCGIPERSIPAFWFIFLGCKKQCVFFKSCQHFSVCDHTNAILFDKQEFIKASWCQTNFFYTLCDKKGRLHSL